MLYKIYENINTVNYISCYIIQPKILQNKNVFGTNLLLLLLQTNLNEMKK